MNTGAIATRYAKALLKYVRETGRGEQVCSQVRQLLRDQSKAPQPLENDLVRFVQLVSDHGRMEHIRAIFRTFLQMYYKSEGIVSARLRTAVPAPQFVKTIQTMLEEKTGSKVILEDEVDPDIMGGFVLEVDDRQLDGSVRHQIDTIRRQFVVENNRIV